ncbi:uncharacterized protein A4U43_C03F10060 [Asparagus officinalis]|uniref:Uncharacterized protein n=1 Tax=Asparagus officinalis TaxID=4686 RepID=A0A5P1FD36_ASPOF|nr:uncharacterized protein A4U43_C03F10060 [Asparagus officinalis]
MKVLTGPTSNTSRTLKYIHRLHSASTTNHMLLLAPMFNSTLLAHQIHEGKVTRWSLIAGRLPGRTANDVKNFWNTHLSKQLLAEKHGKEAEAAYVEVIKPQPQTIPWNWKWSKDNEASESNNQQEEANILKHLSTSSSTNATCLESKNFSASNIEEVGMMQELQADFRSEDIGSFGHDDFLLEGFLGWEDMRADISLWSDFEYI